MLVEFKCLRNDSADKMKSSVYNEKISFYIEMLYKAGI